MSNQDILNKLVEIQNDIQEIKNDVEILKTEICNVRKDSNKMSTHIDFIDNVYDQVKHPLNFVCEKFYGVHKQIKEN